MEWRLVHVAVARHLFLDSSAYLAEIPRCELHLQMVCISCMCLFSGLVFCCHCKARYICLLVYFCFMLYVSMVL